METEIITLKNQDLGRGVVLLIAGAVMMLLTWILPYAAPVAVAAYGIYRLTKRMPTEGLIAIGVGVLLFVLRRPFWWLLWLVAAGMAAMGLFYLLRGFLAPDILEAPPKADDSLAERAQKREEP